MHTSSQVSVEIILKRSAMIAPEKMLIKKNVIRLLKNMMNGIYLN